MSTKAVLLQARALLATTVPNGLSETDAQSVTGQWRAKTGTLALYYWDSATTAIGTPPTSSIMEAGDKQPLEHCGRIPKIPGKQPYEAAADAARDTDGRGGNKESIPRGQGQGRDFCRDFAQPSQVVRCP